MQKDNSLKTAIIAGNHKIDSNFKITFDEKAYKYAFIYKLMYCANTQCDIIHAIDHKITIPEMCSKVPRNHLVPYRLLLPEIRKQIQEGELVIFESSLRNKAKRDKQKSCSILGKNAYRPLNETTVCSCWGLGVILCMKLLEEYKKVVFFTSPDSLQLKVADALKMQQFFQNHDEYKDRFEFVWAK